MLQAAQAKVVSEHGYIRDIRGSPWAVPEERLTKRCPDTLQHAVATQAHRI